MLPFLVLVTIALPITWFVADIRGTARTRRILGVITLLWSFGGAILIAGVIERFSSDAYYGGASKELLEATLEGLRANKTQAVIHALTRANETFHPTYENRARYRQMVDEAIQAMETAKPSL